jgi:hypothetical protein
VIPYIKQIRNFAGKFGQAGAERHIEMFEDNLPQIIGIVSFRHQHGCEGVRIFARFFAENFQTPCENGCAGGFSVALMSTEDVGQALLRQHVQRLAQAKQ